MTKRIFLNFKDNIKVKQLEDYYRILYDLDMVRDMCKKGLKEKNTFLTYQGIVITYRKCFDISSKGRSKSLTNKHLQGLTDSQKLFHQEVLTIGDQYVAHFETKTYEFDVVILILVLKEDNKAIDIEVEHNLREPLDKYKYKQILDVIEVIRQNLTQSIIECSKSIIADYNSKL